jgi:hypothetical protein
MPQLALFGEHLVAHDAFVPDGQFFRAIARFVSRWGCGMRRSEAGAALVATPRAASCEVQLPGGDLGATSPVMDAGAPPPVLAGCRPLHDVDGITRVGGAVRSLARSDGSVLVIVDDTTVSGSDLPSVALTASAGATIDDCLTSAAFTGAAAPAFDPPTLSPLSGVEIAGVANFYYMDPDGAFGVASQDPSDGRFRASGTARWTSDRPTFGTAAVAAGADVYAVGCKSARFLDADCYVARAPAASVADASAYVYAVGSDRWSPRVDDAWPMTSAGTAVDVAWLTTRGRWLMAYVPPLGTTIRVRIGLSPAGPWSAPVDVATCDLAAPDMFCAGVHLHPGLASPAGTIALSYAPASLSADAAARRAASPDDWWPRLVALPVP